MTYEINIYGDIVPFKFFNDGSEFDRSDLNTLIDSLDLNEGDELIYNIHTFGGCTTTAFAMYNKLKRVKNEKKITLTSRADGYCASSGVILLLAADKRIGSKFLKPFVHNAWTFAGGNKDDIKKVYEDLDRVDNAIADLYTDETSISVEQALQFMDESRDLTLDECVQYGFYNEIENVKTVDVEDVFNSIISRRNSNYNTMAKNSNAEKKSLLKKMESFLFGTQNKIVFTAENEELDFYELDEESAPSVGDKAQFDGKPAGESKDGRYLLANGQTLVFEGEELKEIIEKENEIDDLKTENEDLKNQIENLKTQIEEVKNSLSDNETKLSEATEIIKSYKNLVSQEADDDNERDPKPASEEPKVSRAAAALNNYKIKQK